MKITTKGGINVSVRLLRNMTMTLKAGATYDVPEQVPEKKALEMIAMGLVVRVPPPEDKPKGQQRRRGRRR